MPRVVLHWLIAVVGFSTLAAQEVLPDKKKILVVAHRGASLWAPENTIAAFLKAAEMGADYVEMDVRQTVDGHFIIMHDQTVKRTTNGKGYVAEMKLEEIKALDAGSWFGKDFEGEEVPTLMEVLQAIKGKVLPDIDFKAGDPAKLVRLLKDEGWLDEAKVTFHGSWKDCEAVQELTDKLLIRPSSKSGDDGFQKLLDKLNPPIVNIGKSTFSEYYINLVHQKGKFAFVNALRCADKKKFMNRAIDSGADFIQADKIDVLIALLKVRGVDNLIVH